MNNNDEEDKVPTWMRYYPKSISSNHPNARVFDTKVSLERTSHKRIKEGHSANQFGANTFHAKTAEAKKRKREEEDHEEISTEVASERLVEIVEGAIDSECLEFLKECSSKADDIDHTPKRKRAAKYATNNIAEASLLLSMFSMTKPS